jgi:hypothetical protein
MDQFLDIFFTELTLITVSLIFDKFPVGAVRLLVPFVYGLDFYTCFK